MFRTDCELTKHPSRVIKKAARGDGDADAQLSRLIIGPYVSFMEWDKTKKPTSTW